MDKDYFNMSGFNVPPYYGFEGYDYSQPTNQTEPNGVFNPFLQYEQAYMYYRYLSQQMEYKIKCKEFEKLTNSDSKRKIE